MLSVVLEVKNSFQRLTDEGQETPHGVLDILFPAPRQFWGPPYASLGRWFCSYGLGPVSASHEVGARCKDMSEDSGGPPERSGFL